MVRRRLLQLEHFSYRRALGTFFLLFFKMNIDETLSDFKLPKSNVIINDTMLLAKCFKRFAFFQMSGETFYIDNDILRTVYNLLKNLHFSVSSWKTFNFLSIMFNVFLHFYSLKYIKSVLNFASLYETDFVYFWVATNITSNRKIRL